MVDNPFLGVRLPPAIHQAMLDRAQSTGKSRSEIAIAALSAYLNLPADNDDLTLVKQELSEVKQRLSEVEQTLSDVKPRPTPRHTQQPVREALAPSKSGKRLTTKDAYDVAIQRGYYGTLNAFRIWSKRNEAECERMYGLAVLPHNNSKSNKIPRFEDVRE